MKYKFKIKNLSCANCASKIEKTLNKNENFTNVNLNFNNLTLSFESNIENEVLDCVNKIVKEIEPDVLVYDESQEMKKYKFKVSNLDCAACASKIEKRLNELEELENVSLNFAKSTLSFSSNQKDIIKLVKNEIRKIEPEVIIMDENLKKENKIHLDIIELILGVIFVVLGVITSKNIFNIIAYIILLYKVCIKAIKLLIRGEINENFLITISCIGAYFTNNILEGSMVIILYKIGKVLESLAINNSRKSISELMDIKPVYANLKYKNELKIVNPEEVKVDDIIVVKKGEKIPLDGILIKGSSKLNTACLTGESKLKSVNIGDAILSGTINEGEIIEIKVTSNYENSTVTRILDLVENATDKKADTENFVATAAKIYTPVVLILDIVIFIILKFGFKIDNALYRSLSFLVTACPCAIAISVPLAYFTGIGLASKNGVLVKGSNYLDALRNVNKIVFDKTGTITTGEFTDYKLQILTEEYSKEEIIKFFVLGEKFSNHPIAKSIISLFDVKVNEEQVKNYEEVPGKGIKYEIDDLKIKIGSSSFTSAKKLDKNIYLKINDSIIASLELLDGIKKDSKLAIKKLNNMNIDTIMFTGDEKEVAMNIAKKVEIENVKYELLPEDKFNLLQDLIAENTMGKTAFVGDGINDAPSLALADIGISMGTIGSASAIEASDVVISNDSLGKICDAISISKVTNKIIVENLVLSLSVKAIVLILCTFGIAAMWQAVIADTGLTVITILNTRRINKY